MFADWNIYYRPIHLNNVNGTGIAGGSTYEPTDTPFVVLSESNGETYTPKTTNYMDVYSGGSPFTFTQELVQRGAEVQEDVIRIGIIGTTPEDCVDKLHLLRSALTNQHLFGPQILSIKRANQSTYTEWLIHGALIQEESTYLGRDIRDNAYPMLFVSVTITRSPYGSDSFAPYTSEIEYTVNGNVVSDSNLDVLDYQNLNGSYVNFYLNVDYANMLGRPPSTFGPIVLSTVIPDSLYLDTTSRSGSISAGSNVVVGPYPYQILETSNASYPIQSFIVANIDSNNIEMRLLVNGYATPYVRAVGTQLNSTNGTQRLFVLPPINIKDIYHGAKDYSVAYSANIYVQLRNLNRGGTTSYTLLRQYFVRTDNTVQVFPTTNWSSRSISLASINIYSFYDQLQYPSQPLPAIKAHLTTYSSYVGPLETTYYFNNAYQETLEVRGSEITMKQAYGNMRFMIWLMEYNGTAPIGSIGMSNVVVRYAPQYLSIKD